jgi:hypothetical protein
MDVQFHPAASPRLPMNAPLLPEVLYGMHDNAQPRLSLATEDVQRYVWESSYGPMLIEVRGGEIYVNGGRVEPVAQTLRALAGAPRAGGR